MLKQAFILIFAFLGFNSSLTAAGFKLYEKDKTDLKLNIRFASIYQFLSLEKDNGFGLDTFTMELSGDISNALNFEFSIDPVALLGEDPFEFLKDAYLQYKFFDFLNLRFGQFKVPYGEEIHDSLGERSFIDHAILSRKISPGRDRGLTLYGRDIFDFLNYDVGLFNGSGIEMPMNLNDSFMLTFRCYAQFKLIEGLKLKGGYNILYRNHFDKTYHQFFGQGFFARASYKIDKSQKASLLFEYQERLRNIVVINPTDDWRYGFHISGTYQYQWIEGALKFDIDNGSKLIAGSDDILSFQVGLNGRFLDKESLILRLFYVLESQYILSLVNHGLLAMAQLEY